MPRLVLDTPTGAPAIKAPVLVPDAKPIPELRAARPEEIGKPGLIPEPEPSGTRWYKDEVGKWKKTYIPARLEAWTQGFTTGATGAKGADKQLEREFPIVSTAGQFVGGVTPYLVPIGGILAKFALIPVAHEITREVTTPEEQLSPLQRFGKITVAGEFGALTGQIFKNARLAQNIVRRIAEPALGAGANQITESLTQDLISGRRPDVLQALASGGMSAAVIGTVGAATEIPALRSTVFAEAERLTGKKMPSYAEARKVVVEALSLRPDRLTPSFQQAFYEKSVEQAEANINQIARFNGWDKDIVRQVKADRSKRALLEAYYEYLYHKGRQNPAIVQMVKDIKAAMQAKVTPEAPIKPAPAAETPAEAPGITPVAPEPTPVVPEAPIATPTPQAPVKPPVSEAPGIVREETPAVAPEAPKLVPDEAVPGIEKPVTVPPVVPEAGKFFPKRVSEMTQGEYLNWHKVNGTKGSIESHRRMIEFALSEGDQIPEQVLEDYPDLMQIAKGKGLVIPKSEGLTSGQFGIPGVETPATKPVQLSKNEILSKVDEALKVAPPVGVDPVSIGQPATIDFQIDGGVKIVNNQEALNFFRKRIKAASADMFGKKGKIAEAEKVTPPVAEKLPTLVPDEAIPGVEIEKPKPLGSAEKAKQLREIMSIIEPVKAEVLGRVGVTPDEMEGIIGIVEAGVELPPDAQKIVSALTNLSIEQLRKEVAEYERAVQERIIRAGEGDPGSGAGPEAAGDVQSGREIGRKRGRPKAAGRIPVNELIAQGQLTKADIDGAIKQAIAAKRTWLFTVLNRNFFISPEDIAQGLWVEIMKISGWDAKKHADPKVWIVDAMDYALRKILDEYSSPDLKRSSNYLITKYRNIVAKAIDKGEEVPSIEKMAELLSTPKKKISVSTAQYIKFMAEVTIEGLDGLEGVQTGAFALEPGKSLEDLIKQRQERAENDPDLKQVELPELVKLAKILMGDTPMVKKFLRPLGRFLFVEGKDIKWIMLQAKIFKDAQVAAAVLAHEIGHLWDWLPDFITSRGNILGRLATLKGYMKSLLGEKPGMEWTVLDEKDRERLRKEAAQQIKAESKMGEREIIEEIVKEIPIYEATKYTPDVILSIWREAATSIRETHPELYEFITRLSSAELKAVIKQALKGIVDERIMRLGGGKLIGKKIVRETITRRIVPPEPTPREINKRFKELLKAEILKRKLFEEEVIREELKRWTQYWNPFDDTRSLRYTLYRYSSEELYAEAISGLLNVPEKFKQMAPNFWKAFWNYIEEKPTVRDAILEIQALLNSGEEEVLRVRQEDIRTGFKSAEERYMDKRNFWKTKLQSWMFEFLVDFVDRNIGLYNKIREAQKAGKKIMPEENPRYYLEEWAHRGGKLRNLMDDIDEQVILPTKALGITEADLGEYMLLRRIMTERKNIANPGGHDYKTAAKQLDYLKRQLGDIKFAAIEEAVKKFRGIMEKLLVEAVQLQIYTPDMFIKLITNDEYATFQYVEHVDDYVSASIIPQTGGLDWTANPLTSTVLKMLSIKRLIERVKVSNRVINFMIKNFPDEIERAKAIYAGKYGVTFQEKEGFGLIKTRIKGKLAAFYVDPYIADTLNIAPNKINVFLRFFQFMNGIYFRPVYVTFNIGFQSWNLLRDLYRSWALNPWVPYHEILRSYIQALPIAKRRVLGQYDSVIRDMQERGMLSFTFNDLGGERKGETELEYLLRIYQAEKKGTKNPVFQVMNLIKDIGDLIETLPKVSGYLTREKILKRHPEMAKKGLHPLEISHQVRIYTGTPDYARKGRFANDLNAVFIFGNIIKEGFRSDFEGGVRDPKTRSGFWMKNAFITFLPTLLLFLIGLGYFGKKWKDVIDAIPEYDKANFTIIPYGMTDGGKAMYLRLPRFETGRFLGALFWKALKTQSDEGATNIQDIVSVFGAQLPSLNPTADLLAAWISFAQGKDPYDFNTGRPILYDDERLAGGWYSLKPMIGWTAGKLGIYGATMRVSSDDSETVIEKTIRFTPIMQRFIRISDRGYDELDRIDKLEKLRGQAERRLEKKYIYP